MLKLINKENVVTLKENHMTTKIVLLVAQYGKNYSLNA